jgi:hypothetical protein
MNVEELADQLILEIGNDALPNSGASVAAFSVAMVNHILTGGKLTGSELQEFEGHAISFIQNFGKILRTDQRELREAAFGALLSGLTIGVHYAGGPAALHRLKSEVNKERTKKANEAKRQHAVRDIVERFAKKAWASRRGLQDKPHKTAESICDDVVREVNQLPKLPKGWAVPKPDALTDEQRDKAVDRIWRYLGRLKPSTQ